MSSTPIKVSIRPELREDTQSIQAVTRAAFTHSEFGCHGEHELIGELRRNSQYWLSLVALAGPNLVGNVCFSTAALDPSNHRLEGAALGPLAVAPEWQCQGIGARLVQIGMEQTFASGMPFIVVLGDPGYYSRFGFTLAHKLKILHLFAGVPQEYLLIAFADERQGDIAPGSVTYHAAFGDQSKPHP